MSSLPSTKNSNSPTKNSDPEPKPSEFLGISISCCTIFIINFLILLYAAILGMYDFLGPLLIVSIPSLVLIAVFCSKIRLLPAIRVKDNNEHFRRVWLIGCGLFSLCGYTPQILWFFVESYKSKVLLTGMFICNSAACIIGQTFLFSTGHTYKIRHYLSKERCVIYIIHFGYVGLVYLFLRFITKSDEDYVRNTWILQLIYVILFSSSTADFWVICRQGVVKKVDKKPPQVPAICTVAMTTESECHICLRQYSNTVIPRILIQCGHTICQECVVKVMKRQVVACPFCRMCSFVPHGSVMELPKNFALLGLVQEKRGC
ncbi:unnamed protein product [Caenorhabditis brenneri]